MNLIWCVLILTPSIRISLVAGTDNRIWSLQLFGFIPTVWSLHLCSRPFVFLPCLQAMKFNFFLYRLSRPVLLLCFTYEQVHFWVVVLAIWASPSFLLSPLLVTFYAQKHDDLNYFFCWHWITIQFRWDEVKGMSLVVYEDILSETSLCTLQFVDLALLWKFCYYFASFLPPRVWTNNHRLGRTCFSVMLIMNWAFFLGFLIDHLLFIVCCICTGVWPRHLLHHDRVHVYYGAITPCWEYLALYWKYLMDLYIWLYLYLIVVPNLGQSSPYLVLFCNYWFTRIVLQGVSVFRLCHKALAQHRRMLRPALRGFDIISPFLRIHSQFDKQITMHRSSNGMLLFKSNQNFSFDKVMCRITNPT